MPEIVAQALEVETIARRYGISPADVVRGPRWLVDHVNIMRLVEAQ